ncbi:ABC transporter ATP-binding protein [Arthrobacter sp. UM1]|uniref:ABC transporter ATP-binding protein n=1 Tax=Arthrobacter sp. UM1 TaxID=2766776 RepID=UPI001CF67595|nr:ABC transporter ATP-binding protein [Arthrobacter sp. UM1]MCB4208801.1 ABC transporter ATP-binding protein [Arthrobacter sp. UM1]
MSIYHLQSRGVTSAQGVVKSYGDRSSEAVLRGVTYAFRPGSFTAIMGPSGSGKTTLLNCLCGLDVPDSGSVSLDGHSLTGLDEDDRALVRRDTCGFIFQDYNLFEALDVHGNVALPQRLAGRPLSTSDIRGALERVGLADKARSPIGTLSGGQRQRVAIARALASRPGTIFADEPTGALDSRTARDVLALMRQSASELGSTTIMVTHDAVAAAWADDVVVMSDGSIADVVRGGDPDQISRAVNHIWS